MQINLYESVVATTLVWVFSCEIFQVLPKENIISALKTIFELNVMKYQNGEQGAVNGMRPDGRVEKCSVQSDEVWTGVTYGLAATMIYQVL